MLAAIVFLGSMKSWFPFVPSFLQNGYVLWALATPVQFWVGRQFYRGAWAALRHRTTSMDTLIALGSSAAYFYSVLGVVLPRLLRPSRPRGADVLRLGRVDHHPDPGRQDAGGAAKGQTSEAIKKLIGLQPKTARVMREGREQDVPVAQVVPGDLVARATR